MSRTSSKVSPSATIFSMGQPPSGLNEVPAPSTGQGPWRWVEAGENRTPRPERVHREYATSLFGSCFSPSNTLPTGCWKTSPLVLGSPQQAVGATASRLSDARLRPVEMRPDGRSKRCYAARATGSLAVMPCHLLTRRDGTLGLQFSRFVPCRNLAPPYV